MVSSRPWASLLSSADLRSEAFRVYKKHPFSSAGSQVHPNPLALLVQFPVTFPSAHRPQPSISSVSSFLPLSFTLLDGGELCSITPSQGGLEVLLGDQSHQMLGSDVSKDGGPAPSSLPPENQSKEKWPEKWPRPMQSCTPSEAFWHG